MNLPATPGSFGPFESPAFRHGDRSENSQCVLLALSADVAAAVVQILGCKTDLTLTTAPAPIFTQRPDLPGGCLLTALPSDVDYILSLSQWLEYSNSPLQVVYLATLPEVRSIVAAFRHGAHDVLAWPDEADRLVAVVQQACLASTAAWKQTTQSLDAQLKLSRLTPSERAVAERVIAGLSNKKIAGELDIAVRTVELRRKEIFRKLETRSAAEIFAMLQWASRQEAARRNIEHLSPPHAPLNAPHGWQRAAKPT